MFRVAGRAAAVIVLLAAGGAQAASKPSYGPPPSWVEVAPIPEAAPAPDVPVQTLLDDNQSRLGPDGDAFYNRRVVRIVKPEGLTDFTSFGMAWNPDTEGVTFHTLKILRDGKTIDLLQNGKKMLVLRREEDLESAVLDGRISASQQIDDLRVGDVVDVAWTQFRKDPIEQGHPRDLEALSFAGVAARYRVRLSWPQGQDVRWRTTPGFGEPVTSQRDGRTWLDLDLKDAKAPHPPIGAPARYRQVGWMETSGWRSWGDISKTMYPLYAKAAVADAAIKAEAATIAAANPDPKARAFAALRLVEDKTRYFLVAIGQGGYVPASASETWRRKFGDCKGKTVLLIALLKELGVPAEPVLVNTAGGDGLDARLPGLNFDHVLVRATIDGKTYWLDGTRSGDEAGIDSLKPPPYRWGLPVRAEGASLEKIVQPPLDQPQFEGVMRLDASKGLDAPATATFRVRFTGDTAIGMRTAVKVAPRADLERVLKQQFSSSMAWVSVKDITWEDDLAHDGFTVIVSGDADMTWRMNRDVNRLEYRVASGGEASGFPRREPGPNQDAPFAVASPLFVRAATEIVLPNHGQGFTIRGPSDETVVGGYQLKRSSEIKDGVARFWAETRSVAEEISAAEAEAANKKIRELGAEDSLVRAPVS